MSEDLIRKTDFSSTLDRVAEEFRKALLKRWRERAAEVVLEGKGQFPQGWRRGGGAEPLWPYWSPLARLHVDYRHNRCRVLNWAEGDQSGPVPKCEGRLDLGNALGATERPSYVDAKGVKRAVPDSIECGMPQVMAQIEGWSHQEAEAVRKALPQFDVHDLGEIEEAQAALLNIGGQLGLEAGQGSDQSLPFKPASNADLLEDLGKLAGNKDEDPAWYAAWTGAAAKALKDGFFDSVKPTFTNQAGIAGSLSNLYAGRGTIVHQGRAGDLKILTEAAKALGATKTTEADLDVVWKVFGAVGTVVAAFPPATPVGTAISLAGIAGEVFLPKVKNVSYASTVDEAMKAVWKDVDDHNAAIARNEVDFSSGAARVRDLVYGIHSFNLEFYDITQNSAKGSGGKGTHAEVDEVMKMAEACFEAARTYEEKLVPLLNRLDGADPSLADKDGAEGGGDAKLKGLREEFRGFLTTACGRLYETGTQIKEAAERYQRTDEEQAAVFATLEWDDGEAPSDAREQAKATDRSGWKPVGGNVQDVPSRPGRNDPGADDYATALGG